MAALWPIILVAAHTALAEVPKLNIEPTCKAAAIDNSSGRSQEACLRDERQAEATLKKRWNSFSADERQRCSSMVQTGGPPSYVELLTCLQTAEEAAKLPKSELDEPIK